MKKKTPSQKTVSQRATPPAPTVPPILAVDEDAGRIIYEAYCGSRHWKSVLREPLPSWSAMETSLKVSWMTAAKVLLATVTSNGTVSRREPASARPKVEVLGRERGLRFSGGEIQIQPAKVDGAYCTLFKVDYQPTGSTWIFHLPKEGLATLVQLGQSILAGGR